MLHSGADPKQFVIYISDRVLDYADKNTAHDAKRFLEEKILNGEDVMPYLIRLSWLAKGLPDDFIPAPNFPKEGLDYKLLGFEDYQNKDFWKYTLSGKAYIVENAPYHDSIMKVA